MIVGVDYTDLPEEARTALHRFCQDDERRALVEARARQELIARFYRENRPAWRDGIGPQVAAIDPFWRNWWTRHLGTRDCWDDPKFVEWLQRREEMFRLEAKAPKTQVGWRENHAEARSESLVQANGSFGGKILKRYG